VLFSAGVVGRRKAFFAEALAAGPAGKKKAPAEWASHQLTGAGN
jgi:hypothetical protein